MGVLLSPVSEIGPAHWVIESLEAGRFATVAGLVPRVFTHYARVFHPAWRNHAPTRVPVKWVEVARLAQCTTHPLMQWRTLVNRLDAECSSVGASIEGPRVGAIPPLVSEPLKRVLSRHTSDVDSCWYGIWNGWAYEYKPEVPAKVSIGTRFREWDLFRGPLDAL